LSACLPDLGINRITRNIHSAGIDLEDMPDERVPDFSHLLGLHLLAHFITRKKLVHARHQRHLLDEGLRDEHQLDMRHAAFLDGDLISDADDLDVWVKRLD
jgi:hypothetical protein